jgi:hypothetical protein
MYGVPERDKKTASCLNWLLGCVCYRGLVRELIVALDAVVAQADDAQGYGADDGDNG